jgi:hypothetical protein
MACVDSLDSGTIVAAEEEGLAVAGHHRAGAVPGGDEWDADGVRVAADRSDPLCRAVSHSDEYTNSDANADEYSDSDTMAPSFWSDTYPGTFTN